LASRGGSGSGKRFLIPTAIIVAVILYGSLYPFDFHQPNGGRGALQHLLRSWDEKPGRGDLIANVFFYLPLGFFGSPAAAGISRGLPRILLVTLAGGILSTAMELAQYYLPERVSAADDIYANVIGTALGALVGVLAAGNFRWLPFRQFAADRVACLLLALWLGYRLYPYVPTIDLHKYWEALRPAILHPRPVAYDLFRYTAIWLTIGNLIEAIAGPQLGKLVVPLFFAAILAAKIVILGKTLSTAEIAGAIVALAAWLLLAASVGTRLRAALTALLFSAYIVAERLAPFQFTPYRRAFSWVPFRSFLYGALELNIMSFLEKAFLYGALIWLLARSGLGPRVSTILVAIMLFATSWAETRLPGRSAEITDALMAILIGAVIVVLAGPATVAAAKPAVTARQP
jgi:VanZ family protein